MTNSGGILATWLFGDLSPAPRYTTATKTLLIFSVLMGVFSALNIWYLVMQNKCKARARGVRARDLLMILRKWVIEARGSYIVTR